MTIFSLKVLGECRLNSADGRIIGITDRRARYLIAHLAVAGRPVPRHELAELVCPDGDETDQRATLRQTLYLARKAAGSPDLILADGEDLRLNEALVDVDLWRFRAAVHGDPASLGEAVGLYRGPLLARMQVPSAAAESWLAPHRSEAEELALRALLAAALAEEARGRDEEALALLRRALENDPLREDAHRRAMRAFARLGRRTAALRQYHACCEALERELGVAPEPETVALAGRIARNGSEGAAVASGATPAGAERAGAAPPRVRLVATAGDDPSAAGPLRDLVDDLSVALCEHRWFDVIDDTRAADPPEEPTTAGLYLLELRPRPCDGDGAARLTARLSDAARRRLLLTEQLDLPRTPAPVMRDEEVGRLAARVAQAVRTAEISNLCSPEAQPRSAYEHVVHAYWRLSAFKPDDNARAQALLREARRLDPCYGYASNVLLWAVWLGVVFDWPGAPDALAEAVGLAEDALALDPDAPLLRAHLAGTRAVLDRDFETGLAIMRETTARNPHLAIGRGWRGWMEVHAGDPAGGVDHLSAALRLNPESPFNFMWEAAIGVGHVFRGEAAASLCWLRKARHNRPNYPIARAWIAANLAEAGRMAEACAEVAALRELSPRFSAAHIRRLFPDRRGADREGYVAALLRAGLPEA